MRIITPDDIIEAVSKLRQRGLGFLLSKFTFNEKSRTRSAFDDAGLQASQWWIIPRIKERWNERITGDAALGYEEYFVKKYLQAGGSFRMLSLGSGACSHELKFARFPQMTEVVCMDIAANLLREAEQQAREERLDNMKFLVRDVDQYDFPPETFDVVLFHASLHHFRNMDTLLGEKVGRTLKKGGKIVIHEYVGPNRLQFSKEQIGEINRALPAINRTYRRRFRTSFYKNRVYGPGLLRMILADPSECVESERILPTLRKHFTVLEEKPLGGNILMYLLKDIAHHFVDPDTEKARILNELFEAEDRFLQRAESDLMFGVYEKR